MDARLDNPLPSVTADVPDRAPSILDRLLFWRRIELTPLNKRRWENFKAHKRGYWSLWLFAVLFGLSLIAEVIANDKPIVASYKGEILFPVLVDYPEEKFGGFLAVTDYRDPLILKEIADNGWALWPPIAYSYDTINKDYPTRARSDGRCVEDRDGIEIPVGIGYPAPPPWASSTPLCPASPEQLARYNAPGNTNWLGTDDQGRDVLARLIYGFRVSVVFGLILTILASIIGVAAGAVQGYFGGRIDLFFQRLLEIWSSVPELYVLLIISSVLIPGFWTLLFVMLAFQWTGLVGIVRAEFLRARNFEYIRAARALGLSDTTIMWKHVLPNAMVATLTFLPFKLSAAIGSLTALDFLGLGLPPGSPSLGELLLQGKKYLEAPWLGLSGFVLISLMLSLLIFVGEGVRDALDPRKTFR